jgi:hypothetical protein
MTEIERTQQKIADVTRKLATAQDEASQRYYEMCLARWQRWAQKLQHRELLFLCVVDIGFGWCH